MDKTLGHCPFDASWSGSPLAREERKLAANLYFAHNALSDFLGVPD
jgi:hypothetical protein